MAEKLNFLNPVTPASRGTILLKRDDLSTSKERKLIRKKIKNLLLPKKSNAGRNNNGRITTRHQGGGHKKLIRIVQFKLNKFDMPAKVISIDYDPNRNTPLALLEYEDGECQYMVAYEGVKVGDLIAAGSEVDIKNGNSMPLGKVPVGMDVYCVSLRPGSAATVVRSAGTAAKVLGRNENRVIVRLPSGITKELDEKCYATLGRVANSLISNVNIGKAGRNRWKGIRPSVRGVAMNPVDHPHGGGEGKTSGGRHPCTPWGKPTKGYKTVRRKK